MSYVDIKWKGETMFLGRNGQFKQSGVSLTKTAADTVMIEPITSKGVIGRCLLEIPFSALPAVIKFLENAYERQTARPD